MRDRADRRRYKVRSSTLVDLIMDRYELYPSQIGGGPAWAATDEYDIYAVAPGGVQASGQWNLMLQKLLADLVRARSSDRPRVSSSPPRKMRGLEIVSNQRNRP